jgi:beta-lactamase class A
VQIRYEAAPNGLGWVQADLLVYTGDRFTLPAISQSRFNLPTLTPTPSVVQAAQVLGDQAVSLSPAFAALGDQLWNTMLAAGFDPATSRVGTLFLMDLQTGEALAFGADTAFSGMSLNKIAIFTALYAWLDAPPDDALAVEIVEAMTCSENTSTNDLLTTLGGGSPYAGARNVTARLQGLGLEDTFIVAPYTPDERITPEPVTLPVPRADQRVQPDPSNQVTADELGGLLASVYQCAVNENGPLLETYPDDYTPAECRQILNAMSNNRINALIEMGVPEGTVVAHKHGWIDDTHGDAGVVFTPGGDFALVVAVHNPGWMNFEESFPLIANITRMVYNYYNPSAPLAAVREGEVSDVCTVLGNPLVEELLSGDVVLP